MTTLFPVPGTLARLAARDPASYRRLALCMAAAIDRSFSYAPVAHRTDAEVKRRFERALAIYGALRSEMGWAMERVLDQLSTYLRLDLLGLPWEPDKRAVWVPGDDG